MMGLNKLGTTITAMIAVTLTALAVEIIYVLWRRRHRYRPRRVRIEPQEASLPSSSSSQGERDRELELEMELEQHVMKFQRMNGPSRFLFTIREEEEREGLDSENGSSTECSAVVVMKKKVLAVDEVTVAMEELLNEATTPFSTPCASPPYYTPYSSPCREAYKDNNG